jgi:hypothetical protein
MKARFHFAVLYASHYVAHFGFATLRGFRRFRYAVAILALLRLVVRVITGH